MQARGILGTKNTGSVTSVAGSLHSQKDTHTRQHTHTNILTAYCITINSTKRTFQPSFVADKIGHSNRVTTNHNKENGELNREIIQLGEWITSLSKNQDACHWDETASGQTTITGPKKAE